MSDAGRFVEFWLENSVHADEQLSARRGREKIQQLVNRLVAAAKDQGIDEAQMEAEVGDLFVFIRSHLDNMNAVETARLKLDRQ